MKRVFKFVLVALAAAAVTVACQKPAENQTPDKPGPDEKPVEDVVPVEGTSDWSVVGTVLGSNWDKDYVMAASGDNFVLKNLKLAAATEFKIRFQKKWEVDRGGDYAELGKGFAVNQGGHNIKPELDGVYDIWYNPAVEQMAVVAKDGTPEWGEAQPETGFTSPDWASISPVTNGNHTFKFTKDDKYAYFFSERTSEGRFNDIWGGEGYIYFAFDFDNNLETGETLNNNGKYEYIGYIFCFGEKPKVEIVADGDCLPDTYTVENIIAKGSADDNGVKVEYRVPLADLPQLPEKFTIYTWGNKDMAKVVYPVPFEASDDFDYTPSAEYLAEDNLWKAVDANHTIESFYNPNWSGEKTAPELAFKESTYKVTLPDACPADWNAQYWIRPAEQLVLDPAKKYSLKFTVNASTDGQFYVKLYHKGVDGAFSTETNPRVELKANESYEIKLDDFSPITTPQDLLIDFSHHEANTTFYIKDIILKVTGEVPLPVEWDYTPSEEYLASSNLWKAKAAGHEMYYYYNASGADWNGSDIVDSTVPFLTINQSTYELNYAAATNELWQKQFFVFPAEGNEIPFEADKTYKIKVTLGTDAVKTPGFFKIAKYNDSNLKKEGETIWEKGNVSLAGSEPLVIESPEITGVDCSNINLMFAFGGNSADTKVYIKDIIVEEVGGEVPPVVDAPESDVITVDILPNAYPQEEVVVKNGDIEYNIYLVANYGNGIQMKKEGGYISNKTAFKSINTIKITTAESKTLYPENLKLYAGTTENPTTEIAMKSGDKEVAVWELDGEYTYFKMENVSTYAVYLSKIEINPAAEPAPAGITLDGNFDDWADIDAIANEESNSIKEWKYASDSKNFYFYLKISKSDIKAEKAERPEGSGLFPFEKRRYIYIALNTDNNDATGFTPSYGDMTIPGAEVLSLIYPFRGNSTVAQGTDGSEVVNGVDSNSWVGVLSSASERSKTGEQLSAYGVIDDDYGYLEVAMPRAGAQLAAGTYKVQFSLSSTLSHVFEMVVE